jgi:branched-chain amino acid transport system ATP-binding protein
MDPFLSVKNLEVYYGSIHALKGLSFEVQKGEIVSLVGANGAGKTTTLRALSGIVPSAGITQFKGSDLNTVPAHERVRLGIGHSPEGRGVFPLMTVQENLQIGAYIFSDKEKIFSDMEMCFQYFPRLKERRNQPAGTLSGGEQQMVAISRALMSRPELLMLDEPSLGLAPIIISQIFEIIKEVNKNKNMTILLVEQNAKMALKISQRAYVIETGRVSFSGTGQELLNNNEVQKAYLGMN